MIQNIVRCIAAAGFVAFAGSAHAQTCAAPIELAPNSTAYGSTCGHPRIADAFCDGTPNPGPNVIYRLVLEQASDVEFAIGSTSPAFEPALYVSDGGCLSTRCASALRPAQTLPAGDYWIIVAAASTSADGSCGSFGLANVVTPADTIFSGSFD
jgi:hypothetical protein